jgi:hypothetical protein
MFEAELYLRFLKRVESIPLDEPAVRIVVICEIVGWQRLAFHSLCVKRLFSAKLIFRYLGELIHYYLI